MAGRPESRPPEPPLGVDTGHSLTWHCMARQRKMKSDLKAEPGRSDLITINSGTDPLIDGDQVIPKVL